ncbi:MULTISPECIES: SGNH/GDSL hydrolase family protein [unclassified Blastococcus]
MFGLSRPPRWGLVALAVLLIGNLGLFTYLVLRPDPVDPLAGDPSPAAASTADEPRTGGSTASAAPTTTSAPVTTPVVAVYGDGYSTGSTLGGQGAAGWPALLAGRLGAELQMGAVAQSGYAALGVSGQDFADQVAATPVPDAAITIVFGSRNDLGETVPSVAAGAAETLDLIRASAPDTAIVVVGPAWSDADVPTALLAHRDAVAAAASSAGATFVDPLAAGWFSDPEGLIAGDGVSPTDAGHRFIADALTPVVEEVLAEA